MMADFAENLRKLRKQKKLSQQKLGAMLGYGYTAIANYESGRNTPSLKDLMKLASIFGITLDELAGSVSKAKPSTQEEQLLQDFRNLNEREQEIVLKLIHTLRS